MTLLQSFRVYEKMDSIKKCSWTDYNLKVKAKSQRIYDFFLSKKFENMLIKWGDIKVYKDQK